MHSVPNNEFDENNVQRHNVYCILQSYIDITCSRPIIRSDKEIHRAVLIIIKQTKMVR